MKDKTEARYDRIFAHGASQGFMAGIMLTSGIALMFVGWSVSGALLTFFGSLLYLETKF